MGEHVTPTEVNGHGSQTLGLSLGGSGSGTAIEVAPGAQWIVAKIFNDSSQAPILKTARRSPPVLPILKIACERATR